MAQLLAGKTVHDGEREAITGLWDMIHEVVRYGETGVWLVGWF